MIKSTEILACSKAYRRILPVIILLCITQVSCFEEPPMLNKEDNKQIDSLYAAGRKLQLHNLDSICTLRFDSRVAAAVDSIMERRLKEIERLKRRD